jgi:hypothetical protein
MNMEQIEALIAVGIDAVRLVELVTEWAVGRESEHSMRPAPPGPPAKKRRAARARKAGRRGKGDREPGRRP